MRSQRVRAALIRQDLNTTGRLARPCVTHLVPNARIVEEHIQHDKDRLDLARPICDLVKYGLRIDHNALFCLDVNQRERIFLLIPSHPQQFHARRHYLVVRSRIDDVALERLPIEKR